MDNCDGVVSSEVVVAFCGVVLIYSNGKFIKVFFRRFGFCSMLEAELWGIMYGL